MPPALDLSHLPHAVKMAFEDLVAQLMEGYLYIEHKADGTHGDIHADSVTVSSEDGGTGNISADGDGPHTFGGPIDAQDYVDINPIETTKADASMLGGGTGWGAIRRILLGNTGSSSGGASEATGPGIRIRGTGQIHDTDWCLVAGHDNVGPTLAVVYMDSGPSGQAEVPFKIRLNRSGFGMQGFEIVPNAVTAALAGGVSLGSRIDFFSSYNPFTEIHGTTVYGRESVIVGLNTTAGIRLDLEGGVLAVREGDDSAYASLNLLTLLATTSVILGSNDTSGIRLRVSSGSFEVREGDDSAYGPMLALDIAATGANGVQVAAGSGAAPTFNFAVAGDADTGLYQAGSDQIGMAVGGVTGFVFSEALGGFGIFQTINAGAFGTGAVNGSGLIIGRNTSGNGAASWFMLEERDGTDTIFWVDDAGDFRVGTARPTEDNTTVAHNSGTVVGTQTSRRSEKYILGARTNYVHDLEYLLNTPVFDYRLKRHGPEGEIFSGITTDDSPAFGMDEGKSFNPVNAFGYTVNAFKAMQQQITELRAEVEALKKRVE